MNNPHPELENDPRSLRQPMNNNHPERQRRIINMVGGRGAATIFMILRWLS
jgi:hypothetical protein